jgi:RNA polymerase sigma factor (sigma-70 family)
VGDDATAEDVAAEALARAYARWSRVAELPYRDAWVLRVAANLAIDETRRRRPLGTVAPSPDPDDATTLRLALSAGLRSLPRRQRQAVALRYLAGLSDREVAGALGISIGSVKTHLHRDRAALRAAFGPNVDLEVTPVGLE